MSAFLAACPQGQASRTAELFRRSPASGKNSPMKTMTMTLLVTSQPPARLASPVTAVAQTGCFGRTPGSVPADTTCLLAKAQPCPPGDAQQPKAQPCPPGDAEQPKAQPCPPADAQQKPQSAACLADCPDLVLEQVLRWLGPADLTRMERVCRRWSQTARRQALQHDSWQGHYPPHYRRQLARLDGQLLRQTLRRWCDCLAPGSQTRSRLEALQDLALSPGALFCTLAQHRLHRPRLSGHRNELAVPCAGGAVDDLLYSPDGTHLAFRNAERLCRPDELSLWRQGATQLERSTLCPLTADVRWSGMAFSTDSQRLLTVQSPGQLMCWHRQANDSWQSSAPVFLCEDFILQSCFSPDACCLAIRTVSHLLLLFSANAQGLWHQDISHALPAGLSGDVMQFSADSRHFLMMNDNRAFVFDRHDSGWALQDLRKDSQPPAYRCSGTLAPQGDWLALAPVYEYVDIRRGSRFAVEWWHRGKGQDGQQAWQFVGQRRSAAACVYFTMAFRHDSRQLAFPDLLDNGELSVSVLARSGPDNWTLAARLRLGPGIHQGESRRFCCISAVQYSINGSCLVAVSPVGVQLWCCDDSGWAPGAWIANTGGQCVALCQLSPDGFHCAVSWECTGTVTLHGPGAGGYVTKMCSLHEGHVQQLLFSPEGRQLLVSWGNNVVTGFRISLLNLEPA